MSIREILDESIEQECEACGQIRTISMNDLAVGLVREGQIDAKLVALPPCEGCGASEFLVRSADNEPDHPSPGCFGHKHRILVDVLYDNLVKKNRIQSGLDSKSLPQSGPLSEVVTRWFKDGLRLRKPSRTDEEG